jgi:hypothetical protein
MYLILLLKVLPFPSVLNIAAPMVKMQHTSEHKITIPKGAASNPGTILTQKHESTHMYPDVESALNNIRPQPPVLPESGIGKDPRQVFEDAHWTEEEKKGHLAYVESVQKDPKKRGGGGVKGGRVSNLAHFWTDKERNKDLDTPSVQKELPKIPDGEGKRGGVVSNMANLWKDKEKNVVAAPEVQSPRKSKIEDSKTGKVTAGRATGRVGDMASFWTDKEKNKDVNPVRETPKDIKADKRTGKVSNMAELFTEKEKYDEGADRVDNSAHFWTEQERLPSPKGSSLITENSQFTASEPGVDEPVSALRLAATNSEPIKKSVQGGNRVSIHESVKDSIKTGAVGKLPPWRLGAVPPLKPNAMVGHDAESDSGPISGSPKLTHLSKNRARPPTKNRLSSGSNH